MIEIMETIDEREMQNKQSQKGAMGTEAIVKG